MHIAFIVNHFPSISQTFVLNQITGLLDNGHEVDIYATVPDFTGIRSLINRKAFGSSESLPLTHGAVQTYNLLERAYVPGEMPANPVLRPLWDVPLLIRNIICNPRATLKTCRWLRYGNYPDNLGLPKPSLFYSLSPILQSPRHEYDILHAHFGPNGLRGRLFKQLRLLSGALVTTFHGYDVDRYPQLTDPAVYAPLFRHGDLFTGGSNDLLDRLRALGCPVNRLRKVPMGVPLSQFMPSSPPIEPPIKILTVARLSKEKGIEFGIRAIDLLRHEISGIEYHIVGDGPLRPEIESLVTDLDLSQYVHLHGAQPHEQVREFYDQAHLFMLPSVTGPHGEQESQGLVLQEAQAMKLPVVTTDVGGLPEGLLPDESGFVVPERDPNALADRLLFLATHPEKRVTMGERGRAFVKTHYASDMLVDRLIARYEEVA